MQTNYRELLLGCGNQRVKKLGPDARPHWENLTTVDIDPACKPDYVCTLDSNWWGYEFDEDPGYDWATDDTYDEVHAYEVLEHIGRQGDYLSFFAHFSEIWRILKADGHLFATVPSLVSPWLWGDPGHCRAITLQSLTFLMQPEYNRQVGVTAMTDYRGTYKADFEPILLQDDGQFLKIILRAIKPSRISSAVASRHRVLP